MAHLQQQYSSQSFSPPASSPSPSAASPVNGAPPPPKRQRLSPLPPSQSQSPYASPSFGTLQLPQTQQLPTNGTNVTNVNGMAPAAPSGAMGPPSRPPDKPTDAADLTDVVASSGIDVREEEAFLTRSYSGAGVQAQQPPHPQPPNVSFASQTSTSSFGDPSQLKQDSFITEPSSQPTAPIRDSNESTLEDTVAAQRAQFHLQEPFLLTKMLEQKLQKRGVDLGVRIPSEGLFHPVPGRPQPIEVSGPDGSSVVRTGQTILNQEGAPLVDILNLMSIACEERLRNVLDYASTLARSRRAHSHAVVPAEWKEVASSVANGETTPQKRMFSAHDCLDLTDVSGPHSAVDTSSPATEKVKNTTKKEVNLEESRAAKRTKRDVSAIESEHKPDSGDVSASGTSTPLGEKAPGKMTKKEAKKMMDTKVSEAQQHQQSVETARMATNSMLSGRVFGNKKKYTWLTGGQSTSSGFSTPSRGAAGTPGGGDRTGRAGPAAAPTKRLGIWREDQKEKGSGIQLRDILFMLDVDGRGRKHAQKAYTKEAKEDRAE